MEGRSLARPARRLVVSVVPDTLGVTIDVPSMLVSTLTISGRVVSRMDGCCGKVVEWNRGHRKRRVGDGDRRVRCDGHGDCDPSSSRARISTKGRELVVLSGVIF